MEGVEDTMYFEAVPENIVSFLIRHQYAQISAIGTIDEKTYLTAQMGIIPAPPLKTVSKE